MKKQILPAVLLACILTACGTAPAPGEAGETETTLPAVTEPETWNGYALDTVQLTVENGTTDMLQKAVQNLHQLSVLELTGTLPEAAQLRALMERYPEVTFLWTVTADGEQISNQETSLIVRSLDGLGETMDYLPALTNITLEEAVPAAELAELVKAYPQIAFDGTVTAFGREFSLDAEEIDLSKIPMEDPEGVETILPCFRNLKKVDMCECGLDNETMDALNRRYEDIQIVWSVKVCWRMLRTDITWFFPFKLDVEPTGNDLYNLRYCTEIECVDIGHAEVKDIAWAEFMPKLKYLIFGDTAISDISPLENHKELVYLEMFKTPVTDYTPLLTCTALEDLNLSYTYGDPEPISKMTWLKNVWWHRPTPPWGGPESEIRLNLAQYLPHAYVDVRYTNGSTDGGWRDLPNYFAQRDFLGMFYMEG